MLKSNYELIERKIFDSFGEKCRVRSVEDTETRFSLKVEGDGVSMLMAGSEARVCVKIFTTEIEDDLKGVLLSAVSNAEDEVRNCLAPYILTLWKNDQKDYKQIPSQQKLEKERGLVFEICTGPCDISTANKVNAILEPLLMKSLRWLFSYRAAGESEGERHKYISSKVERSVVNRKTCISIFGVECQVCREKMSDKYGDLAEGFIHVHHLESIAKNGVRWIDPRKDLIPVCPNCHSILHRQEPPLLPSELRNLIEKRRCL